MSSPKVIRYDMNKPMTEAKPIKPGHLPVPVTTKVSSTTRALDEKREITLGDIFEERFKTPIDYNTIYRDDFNTPTIVTFLDNKERNGDKQKSKESKFQINVYDKNMYQFQSNNNIYRNPINKDNQIYQDPMQSQQFNQIHQQQSPMIDECQHVIYQFPNTYGMIPNFSNVGNMQITNFDQMNQMKMSNYRNASRIESVNQKIRTNARKQRK